MSSDRTDQSLTLEDGRQLGFAEFGTPAGRPVFHFHGSASSRLERPPSEDLLIQADVRLITIDRPGHGLSDFQPDRQLLDWPRDVERLADHLGIEEFHVHGHSAGGPHALACAYSLPDRVVAAGASSSVAPMSRPGAHTGMPVLNQILARSARRAPWVTRLLRRLVRRMVMGDAEQAARRLMSSIPDSDKAVLYAEQNVALLVESLREGFRRNALGVAFDDTLVNRDWGFRLESVVPRIDIWHGQSDVTVPVHAGEYLHSVLPNSRATFLPGEGHFFLLRHWLEVLTGVVDGT